MKSKINQFFKITLYILISNTYSLKAHDSFNGGCKRHCDHSINAIKEVSNQIYKKDKREIKDNYSCLKKSLCRG